MKTRSNNPKYGNRESICGSVTAISAVANKKKVKSRSEEPTSTLQDISPSELAKLKETIDQLPEIDASRIVELHERIANGEYKIDSKSLAAKLQRFEKDF